MSLPIPSLLLEVIGNLEFFCMREKQFTLMPPLKSEKFYHFDATAAKKSCIGTQSFPNSRRQIVLKIICCLEELAYNRFALISFKTQVFLSLLILISSQICSLMKTILQIPFLFLSLFSPKHRRTASGKQIYCQIMDSLLSGGMQTILPQRILFPVHGLCFQVTFSVI